MQANMRSSACESHSLFAASTPPKPTAQTPRGLAVQIRKQSIYAKAEQ